MIEIIGIEYYLSSLESYNDDGLLTHQHLGERGQFAQNHQIRADAALWSSAETEGQLLYHSYCGRLTSCITSALFKLINIVRPKSKIDWVLIETAFNKQVWQAMLLPIYVVMVLPYRAWGYCTAMPTSSRTRSAESTTAVRTHRRHDTHTHTPHAP